MDLNDLKLLAAASLLAGSVRAGVGGIIKPTAKEIEESVKTAQRIWDETIRQDREG